MDALDDAVLSEQDEELSQQARVAHLGGPRAGYERKKFQALLSLVGDFRAACALADDLILWRLERASDAKLREWALAYEDGFAEIDPDAHALMDKRLTAYRQNRHFMSILDNIDAMKTITDEIKVKGEVKQPVLASYLGANINYGVDKGGYGIQKQATAGLLNLGTVNLIAPPGKNFTTPISEKRASKKRQQKYIDAEVKVLDAG